MVEVFRGISAVNLDAKGRLSIPSKYREGLQGQSMVLTIDTEDPCLQLYPMSRWSIIESQLEALPTFNPAARRIQRLLLGHATECELDSQSRILVPAVLREHAELVKKVMLVGQVSDLKFGQKYCGLRSGKNGLIKKQMVRKTPRIMFWMI